MANTQKKSSTRVKEGTRLRKPRNYKVIMHNDDVTTMDFVVEVLMSVFFKPKQEAQDLMMKIHLEGQAVVGVYPYDIAQSKTLKATELAQNNGFPLKITCSPE